MVSIQDIHGGHDCYILVIGDNRVIDTHLLELP